MCPVYDILNKKTGEIEEKFMTLSEYEKFKEENPDHQQHFSTMHFQDSVSLGIRKPPRDFTEGVIGRIKKNNPGHNIQSRWD